MLYYSQGKGDTDEKVKTLRPERFKWQNKKQKPFEIKKVWNHNLKRSENQQSNNLRLDNTAEREVIQRC